MDLGLTRVLVHLPEQLTVFRIIRTIFLDGMDVGGRRERESDERGGGGCESNTENKPIRSPYFVYILLRIKNQTENIYQYESHVWTFSRIERVPVPRKPRTISNEA